ncbi:CP2H1 protein, partial [Acrocephalus arundinaceus]|nr:CP2H1 protein [Acrocephalus arundinaceus]
NIICSIVFGDRFDYEDKKFLALIDWIEENNNLQASIQTQIYNFFPTVMDYLPGPHQQLIKNFEKVDKFTTDIVMEHQKTRDPACPRDFIDAFLNKMDQEKGNADTKFTVETLSRTTLDLFLAGTGTTSITLRFAILILHKYPEIVGNGNKQF